MSLYTVGSGTIPNGWTREPIPNPNTGSPKSVGVSGILARVGVLGRLGGFFWYCVGGAPAQPTAYMARGEQSGPCPMTLTDFPRVLTSLSRFTYLFCGVPSLISKRITS